jgi:hypothetical protein
MEAYPELARCSRCVFVERCVRRPTSSPTETVRVVSSRREVLIEMVTRHKKELAEATEKAEQLEEGRSELVNESAMLVRDLDMLKGRTDELLAEQSRT